MKAPIYTSLLIGLMFSITTFGQTIQRINYGNSFGECSGYCKLDMTIDSINTTNQKTSWNDKNYPELKRTTKTDRNQWKTLTGSISLQNFFLLANTIGCPDCTDGGAEWIEIKTSNKSYKVTFEYGSNIQGFEKLLSELRKKANQEDIKVETKSKTDSIDVYIFVDQMPEFPGGISALNKYISEKLYEPTKDRCEYKFSGTVYVNFIVEKDGSLSNIKILKGTNGCSACDTKALEIIKTMPKWIPGKQDKINVRTFYSYPIKFKATD
jgi:TonB family protein